jgi:diacylglycerol kinase
MKISENIKDRGRSFIPAWNGLRLLATTEANFCAHLVAVVVVIIAGCFAGLSPTKWAILAGCMALVLATEALNTAIEKLCDLVHPGQHPQIKQIKDISAAAVLIAAIASVITGVLVFLF